MRVPPPGLSIRADAGGRSQEKTAENCNIDRSYDGALGLWFPNQAGRANLWDALLALHE